MDANQLRCYLEFYRDLGFTTLYKRAPGNVRGTASRSEEGATTERSEIPDPPLTHVGGREVAAERRPSGTGSSVAQPAVLPGILGGDVLLPSLAPENDTLEKIREDIGDCKRCRLHAGRQKIVFGTGDPQAKLVFVGEGPGADEDTQGVPFVGRAGQLLTQMIENTARREGIPLVRKDVYICNVVKCRPPENRTPEPDEMEICGQFLFRQLLAIRPKAICVLGATAVRALLGRKEGVTRLRGNWYKWRDIPVMVTYHPSYLLRPYNQNAKREAWEDLKRVLHFVYD